MKNRIVSLFFSLLVIGIVPMSCSLIPYPTKKTEWYLVPCSKICYDRCRFVVSSNSSVYRTIEGEGAFSTMQARTVLSIDFQIQSGDVNFSIECRSVTLVYDEIAPTQRVVRNEVPLYTPKIDSMGEWFTRQSCSASSLNMNHSVLEGGLCRLRFENTDPQTEKTVDLTVIEYWTEVDYGDVTTNFYLLPFEFTYVGATTTAIGAVVLTWGITTKKVTRAKFVSTIEEVSGDTCYYMEMKKVIIVIMLTLILLFLSVFVHTRIGVGEVLVDEETRKTFFSYHGFPFEIMGTLTPLTAEDWDLVHGPVFLFSKEIWPVGGSNRYEYDELYCSYGPTEGSLLILWDGLLMNAVFYFALSFALVLALSYTEERLREYSLADAIRRLTNF